MAKESGERDSAIGCGAAIAIALVLAAVYYAWPLIIGGLVVAAAIWRAMKIGPTLPMESRATEILVAIAVVAVIVSIWGEVVWLGRQTTTAVSTSAGPPTTATVSSEATRSQVSATSSSEPIRISTTTATAISTAATTTPVKTVPVPPPTLPPVHFPTTTSKPIVPPPPAPSVAPPPTTPRTTLTKPQPSGSCHPSYAGACVPNDGRDVDCAGGSGNGPHYVSGPFQVVGPDVFDLDRDSDGKACE